MGRFFWTKNNKTTPILTEKIKAKNIRKSTILDDFNTFAIKLNNLTPNWMRNNTQLESDRIVATIIRLESRIADRFPDSGLRKVVNQFLEIASKSKKNIEWIAKPNILIRVLSYFLIIIGTVALIYSFTLIDLKIENRTISNILSLSESLFNDLILIGAAIFFMVTIETRIKRHRASKLLNDLRVIAHVIDMHQLTKDPGMLLEPKKITQNSPKRKLSKFELQRYLDYCSEALSLIGKVAALYAQSLPNEVVVKTVNEIEVLSTGFSRKIWQKLIILNEMDSMTKKKPKKPKRKGVTATKKSSDVKKK